MGETSTKIAKNAIYNVMAFSINLAVTFLLVPLMLRYLGATGFGVFAIVRVFVSYASLGDLGLNSTVTKYVAEYSATNRIDAIERVLKAAFVLYAAVAVVLLLLALLFQQLILDLFFSTSGDAAGDVLFVLYGSLIIFGVNMIFSILPNALAGIQRMDLTNSVIALYSLVNGVSMYVALVAGWGLRGLVWANALSTIVAIAANWILFSRYMGHVRFFGSKITRQDLRQLIGFSKHIFTVAVATNIHQHFDKLLLSSFLNLNIVAAYEIGSRIVQQVRTIPVLMLNPLLPAASEFHAQDRSENLKELYLRSMKYLLAMSVPLMGCTGLFAVPFVKVWLGDANELIVPTIQILIISNFINLATGPGFYIAIGAGGVRLPMYSSLVGLSLNIVLSLVLINFFGYFGAVFGSFSALIIASLYFLILVHRLFDVAWTPLLKMTAKPFSALLPGFGVWWALLHITEDPLVQLLSMVSLTLVLYVGTLLLLRYFDEFDKKTILSVLTKTLQFFRRLRT